jgi:hypothetical protein
LVTDGSTAPDGSREGHDHTFTVSEQFMNSRQRLMIGLLAVITIVPFLVLALEPTGLDRLIVSAATLLLIDLAIVAGSVLLGRYLSRQLRRTRLVVGPTGVAREAGHARDSVAWKDVTMVRVRHDRGSVPTVVEVFRTGGRSLQLYGFDGMADLASDLRAHIPATARYVSKPQWAIASDKPAVRITVMAGVMLSAVALNTLVDRSVMGRLTGILTLGIGVWTLGFRPASRTNPSFRLLDVGVGLLLLVGAYRMLLISPR